ncbi:MAG: diguanylate cyclase [Leptothrix sp. (in: b-proteobacteria)]
MKTSAAWLPYAAAAGVVALLVLVLASVSIQQERLRRIEQVRQAVDNTTRLLEAHLTDRLDKIDIALLSMVEQADEVTLAHRSIDQLRLELTAAPLHRITGATFWATDAQGQAFFHYGDAPSEPPAKVVNPLFFSQTQGQTDTGLMVAGPLRSTPEGAWHMVLARPIRLPGAAESPDPQHGVAYAEVAIEHLGQLLRELKLGPNSALTLRTTDLALLYRQPWPKNAQITIGSRDVSQQLLESIATKPSAGSFVARTAIDGVRRVNAYRQVGNYPFYVLVGLPLDEFPQDWSLQDILTLLLALLTIGISAGLLLRLHQTSQRMADAAQRRYEAIVESSHDAIISKTLDGKVSSWNAAAQQMFGYSAAEMIGQSLLRLFPPDRHDEEQQILAKIMRDEIVESFETVRVRKDGRHIDVSVTISPVHDAQGQIIGASKIARDISRQKAADEAIRRLAYRDALTGLPNRRLLLDRLRHAAAMSQRSHAYGALLFIDLDKFKQLNDSHGHEAGDAMLVAVAQRLQSAVRDSDTVARYGGDEFVVLCENISTLREEAERHAQALAQKISSALNAEFQLGSLRYLGGASIGTHLFLGDAEDIDRLLKAADAAMYRAKSVRREALQAKDTLWGDIDRS